MTRSSKSAQLQSWITPCFAWANIANSFIIIVSADDGEIVEFISKGIFEVALSGTKRCAKLTSALLGKATLRGQLHEAVWDPNRLMPADWKARRNTDVSAYFVAAFLLPDKKNWDLW